MTNSDNAALRQYYRSIRTDLSNCPCKQRNRILKELKANVSAFLEADPQADFQKVQAHFGTSQLIASSYLSDLTDTELLGAVKKRKIWPIVVSFFVAAFLVWLIVVGWALINEQQENDGTVVTTPVIEVTP